VQNLPYADTLVSIGHLYFFRRTSDNRLWLGGWLHGPQGVLFSSTNNGQQWDTVGVIPNGTMIVARVFDMCEAGDGSYFIGFHPGPDSVVFRSTDAGATWHGCGALAGANEALCLLKTADGTIFAGTTPNGDVFRYEPTGVEEAVNCEVARVRLGQTVVRGVLLLPTSPFTLHYSLFGPAGQKVADLKPGVNDVRKLAPGIYFLRPSGTVPAGQWTVPVRAKVVVTE
jgi:photosystem II stability/assembly factor-like uncharacterized protein